MDSKTPSSSPAPASLREAVEAILRKHLVGKHAGWESYLQFATTEILSLVRSPSPSQTGENDAGVLDLLRLADRALLLVGKCNLFGAVHGSGMAAREAIDAYMRARKETLAAAPSQGAQADAGTCEWKGSDPEYGGEWNTACGEAWCFTEGDPVENRVKFCIGCGKPVKVTPWVPPADPDDEAATPLPREGAQADAGGDKAQCQNCERETARIPDFGYVCGMCWNAANEGHGRGLVPEENGHVPRGFGNMRTCAKCGLLVPAKSKCKGKVKIDLRAAGSTPQGGSK